jgi:allene oxide cyclase
MKRLLVPTIGAAAAVLVFAVVSASAGHTKHPKPGKGHRGGNTIHVVEHATTDAITNPTGGTGAVGDVLTFANDLFDSANAAKVGSDQGYCVRIVAGTSWECVWTTFLPAGQITVEGPFYDASDSELAITGGTGAYRNVRGSMDLHARNPAGTEFDFVFHIIG